MGEAEGIVLAGVAKSFGKTQVLEGLDLIFKRGKFSTLLGPSGCGKTTLLRLLAGLENLDAGSICFFGQDVSRLPVAERNCSILFQSYALFPNLAVAANVGFGLRARGVSRAHRREKVAELLQLVGLGGYGARMPAQLSGGQQQRVALARALAVEPKVLLLDEPLSALDAKVRLRLRTEIRQLQRRLGVTTIMVTHDQDEALSVSDEIFLLLDGKIQQSGPPRELYECPANRFVADFIGSANFFKGWTVATEGTLQRDGHVLRVSGPIPEGPGPFTLMVRPEHVHLAGAEEEEAGLPGLVQWSEFRGAHERVGIEVAANGGGEKIFLEADVPVSNRKWRAGARVWVLPDPEQVRAFAEGGV